MRYFSLFSGIGGFEIGIQQAYVEITDRKKNRRSKKNPQKTTFEILNRLVASQGKASYSARRWNGEMPDGKYDQRAPHCAGYSEIDRHAIQIYQKHFPNHKNYGDITKIDEKKLPDFDLLVGGFPCQSFSIAGKRGGFNDTRGTLFFEIARIVREKQPAYLLLENVKGLLNHDEGRTFGTIVNTLDELGYDLQWQVLNSKNHGVPQNRERVFIVGHLRGTPRPKVFPFFESDELPSARRGQGKIAGGISPAITSNYKRGVHSGGEAYIQVGTLRTHKDGQGFREKKDGLVPTIPARAREDGSGQPVIMQRARGNNKGNMHKIAPTLTGNFYEHNNHLAKTVRAGGRGSPHGAKQNWDSYEVTGQIRRLTPMECERLQGFPDGYTAEVSDTQRYKCLGNAVTVNVIRDIMEKLLCTSILKS